MSSKAHGAEQSYNVGRTADAETAGSRESFLIALESLRSYLLLVARRELGRDLWSKASPSDVVQETLLKAHRDLASFRGQSEAELRAWLCGILAHCILEFRRRFDCQGRDIRREEEPCDGDGRSVPGQELRPSLEPPSREAIRRERLWLLQEALRRLPEDDRRLVAWRQTEGCTFQEMGRRLGCSVVTARKAWLRALERLRDELGPLWQDSSIGGDPDADR
jgi:RNA polymerase sigma-70 factor, ECF subfamily